MDLCHTKNMGLSGKLDEIDTDMSSIFPIQVIVCVGFSFWEGTQIDLRPKMETFLNKFCSFVYSIVNRSSFSNNVFRRASIIFFG